MPKHKLPNRQRSIAMFFFTDFLYFSVVLTNKLHPCLNIIQNELYTKYFNDVVH